MQRRFWAGSVCAALFLSVLVTLPAPAFGSGNPAGNDISAPSSGAAASNPATGSELRRLVVRDGSAQVIVGLDTAFVPEGRLTRSRTGQQRDGIERAGDALFERLSGTRYEKIREFETIPYVVVDVSARALAALERSPGVTSIVEDAVMAPTLATSTKIVEVPQMGNIGYTGDGKVVAVLDTGVESTHTFLTGKVVEEACFSSGSDCPNGLTTQVGAGSAAPCTYSNLCNHGTHVAGIAAGAGPTSTGVAKDADVMAVQVFSQFTGASCGSTPSPCPLSTSSDQIAALQRVYQLRSTHSFAAVNLSLGGGQFFGTCDGSNSAFKTAVDNLRSAGIATVIASGNDGYRNAIGSPSCVSTAIAVGSTTKTDQVSSFSNMSNQVALLAPGSSITSSVLNNNFASFNGTSMATPHVAGAFAVLKEQNPAATVTSLLSAMQSGGRSVTDTRTSPSGTVTKPRLRLAGAAGVLNPLANDNFANSILLTGDDATLSGHNVGGTKQAGEPNHGQPDNAGGSSVWYHWTPSIDGSATIDTVGSDFDTILSVYTGSAVGSLTEVAGNDDIDDGNRRSSVTFPATGGTTYRIAVDGYNEGGARSADAGDTVVHAVGGADLTGPINPALSSPSHDENTWSNDTTVDVSWTGASDPGSGVDGFSFLWSTNPDTIPNQTIDAQEAVSSSTSPPLADGNSHYFHLRSADNTGNWSDSVHLGPFFIDTVAPGASTMTIPEKFQKKKTFDLSWSPSTDAASGVAGYELEQQSASFDGDVGAFSLFDDVSGAATTFPGALGRTYCIRVSPHDDAGNSASPSASACTSVPLDDRSFSRSNGWKAKAKPSRYAGTFLESDTQGSSLTLNGVRAKQLALLVTKCRGCGSVQVLWDNVPLAKLGTSNSILGLGSATTKNKELIVLEPLDQLETGTVKVKVTSPHGRPVKIDGLGIAKA